MEDCTHIQEPADNTYRCVEADRWRDLLHREDASGYCCNRNDMMVAGLLRGCMKNICGRVLLESISCEGYHRRSAGRSVVRI